MPVSIVSDRDPRITTHFWKSFQKAMGAQLKEHCVSSEDRWSIGEDHIDFKGHVASMRPGS